MDLLKAELERKKRAIAETSNTDTNSSSKNKKKKYLTAAERRRIEDDEEERQEEIQREEKERRKKKKRKRKKRNDSDSDDDDEREDLTTLLLTSHKKKIDAVKAASAAAVSSSDNNNKQEENKANASNAVTDNGGDTKENQKYDGTIPESLKKLSPNEVTNALRSIGLPVRLFGEQTITVSSFKDNNNKNNDDNSEVEKDKPVVVDDTARLQRLSIAMQGREAAMLRENEDDEYLLASANRTRNVFLKGKGNEDDEEEDHLKDANKSPTKASKSNDGADKSTATTTAKELTQEEMNDKPKRIYRYLKNLIKQWEEDLSNRPDAVKRTAAGKNETKTLKQCKDYIRPLFQSCKRRQLEEDLQAHLFKIVNYCDEGEFVKAHDSYMDVAIGRAAWPIGVTQVGIHSRSGRAKIDSSNVAHVMNSELHRKYLTSVKRLMVYNQRKRTDVAPSKKVMNI